MPMNPRLVITWLLVCAAVYPIAAQTPGSNEGSDQQQSLADVARSLRKNKPAEVVIQPQDAKELFRYVDEIFKFASEDTGLPQKNPVKRRLIGQADVENFVRERVSSKEY